MPGNTKKAGMYCFFQISAIPEMVLQRESFKFLRQMLMLTSETKQKTVFTDADIEKYITAWSQPGAIQAALNYYRANWNFARLLAMTPKQQEDMMNRFPKITPPTLVIWGEKDGALDISLNDHLAEYIAGDFKLQFIADAGHWVHLESPDLVNKEILSFLNI